MSSFGLAIARRAQQMLSPPSGLLECRILAGMAAYEEET
jgi:hypothetical protein